MDYLKIIVIAVLIALGVRTCAYQPFKIPTGSMEPTLMVGDYLFVSKFAYGYSKYSFPVNVPFYPERMWGSEPQRGDVAVFRPPNRPKLDYVKRVIGVPGDTVQMKEGRLYINDLQIPRSFDKMSLNSDGHLESVEFKIYTETLPGGLEHLIQEINDSYTADDTQPFSVPAKHFFMMGDNRDRSSDSRLEVGLVPYENFVGRATNIFYSIDYDGQWYEFWKWPVGTRYTRLFDSIR